MIEAIKEINFPSYATLSKATVVLNDMGDRTITTEIKIDGATTPDFSYDWEVEFKGERYIQPLRKPQALKDNQSLKSTINLTFYHWAIYQLKRDFFVELASTQAGSAFADKYVVPLAVNLKEFVTAFNNVLSYYFPDGKIYADLNPAWQYDAEKQYVDINYSYLWDVLQKTHELFNVRWSIEKDSSGNYAIRFGYPAEELTHIFEYGFEGGLLKVERQVQDTNIRNKILGRGGSKNLPYLYFKDYDKYQQGGNGNQGMIPDPDAIPELGNIYFSELRDSNFRSYVQGWKSNPNRMLVAGDVVEPLDAERAESDYAYMRGATDEKFDPVEYVKDDESIAEYGELVGKIENNEDCFPTLQGMEIEIESPDGETFLTRADEVVAVEEVTTDAIVNNEDTQAKKTEIESSREFSFTKEPIIDLNKVKTRTFREKLIEFEIPEGKEGFISNIPDIKYDVLLAYDTIISQSGPNSHTTRYSAGNNTISYTSKDKEFPKVQSIQLWDVFNNTTIPLNTKLVSGKYQIEVEIYIPEQDLKTGEINRSVSKRGNNIYTTITSISKYNWVTRNIRVSVPITIGSFNGVILFNRDENGIAFSKNIALESGKSETITILGETFSVPEQGAMMVDVPISIDPKETSIFSEKTIKVINTDTNEIVPATNIPEGNYQLLVETKLSNTADVIKNIAVELLPGFLYFTTDVEKWQPTFDVWIKNIFNTRKDDYLSEEAYVDGVWSPLRTEENMILTFSSGNLSGHDNWEFRIKKDGIAYDNSKTIIDARGNEVRSEWRLTLIKSDAEIETIKKYIPYKDFNAKAGDFFFFTGIFLPHQYVLSAEKELTSYKADMLAEVKDIKPQWVVSLDKVRAYQGGAERLINSLSLGSVVTLRDKRFTKDVGERQVLQSITYDWQEGVLLPSIDVVLSDKITTSLSSVAMLQGKVESLAKQVGGLSNLEQIVRKVGDVLYLRKDGFADTSFSPTKFADTVSSENFRSGAIGGSGWGAYTDESGRSVIEADKLFIRNEMQVNSLIVNQIAALGGMKILSAADLTISKVETVILENDVVGDRCFFDTRGGSKANLFAIDDIAYSNMLDSENIELKYYKRRVIEVGPDYITLSTTDLDGNGAPQKGDVIVQFGNFTDPARQSFIIIEPLNGGKIEVYAGVDSFNLTGCNMTGLGVNPTTKEAFLYGYGDMFFGDRKLESDFITYQKRDGEDKRTLNVNATVNFSSDSTGLSNLEEFKSIQESVSKLNRTVEEVQDQIDGVIENWSGEYSPTLDTLPTSKWEELGNDALIAHINDTFINVSDGEEGGKAWRWCECYNISEFSGTIALYTDIIPTRAWFKLGTLDKAHRYTSVNSLGTVVSITYDTDISIREDLYVRIEKDTYDVYVLDKFGYYENDACDLLFAYMDVIQATSNNGMPIFLHWHPISDTDSLIALKEAAEAKTKVNDLMFLSETFKKGETNISGGVVMTEMVAVGEGGNNIKAFLNGNDEFSDDEHETLILAGGIPATSKSGSADLKDRAKEAKIKMYENGDFVMNGGGISVERGNVGPFYLGEYAIATNSEDTSLLLGHKNFAFKHKDDSSELLISMGNSPHSSTDILYDSEGNRSFSVQTSYTRGLQLESTDTGNQTSGLLSINRNGDGSKCAISVARGYIEGLRPRVRTVGSSSTLSNLDHSIMISSSTTLNINLPSNAEAGQTIEFYLPYSNSTTLKHRILGNGLGIQCPHNDTWNNSYFDILAYGVVKFICIEDANGDLHWWFYRIA